MERTLLVTFYSILTCLAESNASRTWNGTQEDLKMLDLLLKQYDRRSLPTSHLGKPTVVACEIYIRSFGSINPSTMDYEVDLYLRQSWEDGRLKTNNLTRSLDLNDPNLVKKIWKPEVFFPNAKSAEFQYITVPNVLVRVSPGGKILYMLRCIMETVEESKLLAPFLSRQITNKMENNSLYWTTQPFTFS